MRFKTCRLLSGNVRNRELTIIQRRILRRLRNKKRSIKRKIYPRENLNSYIQSQTTRKLPLFHGDLPITEMHRGTERTSYIPFLLNPETRSDVIPVRLHFRETIPQARQPISHRRVCVNNRMVSITRLKVSHGDLISFQENDARIRGEEIRRSFYIEISVEKIIGKFLDHPVRMWRRTKTEWFHLLKTKRGCRLLLKSRFLQQQLRYSMQEEDFERTKKFGSEKVCLGSSFAEHNRMKRNWATFILIASRLIANWILPGSTIVITIVVELLTRRPAIAYAAGPGDCWTGDPDERLLRSVDRKLTKIKEKLNNLAEKVVEKGALWGMGLPGSTQEQKKDIALILDTRLETLDIDRRLRQISKWGGESELESPDSSFWLMIVEEIQKC